MYGSELTVVPVGMNSFYTTPLPSKKAVSMTFQAQGVAFSFPGARKSLWQYSANCLILRLEMMHPISVHSGSITHEFIAFMLILQQQLLAMSIHNF
jgi:hypothetical protein